MTGTAKAMHAENRRSRFEVEVDETFEAGLVLSGDEIKSIRSGHVQLTGGYVKLMRGKANSQQLPQAVLIGSHLSRAKVPDRTRSLLLHAKEVRQIESALGMKGKLAVPLKLYIKGGWAKVLVGIGKGRRQYDKRTLLRTRDQEREKQRDLKNIR